ncbi:isochorismate synthase MenF [Halovenus rubra]|uniref:Isochorismate synthase MenF n=2 Tax=Halovenus rubra TaxID=869890 RepID=A0ACC7E1Z1_9EURY|nr:isochorismate synthase [Halovenus rubra]
MESTRGDEVAAGEPCVVQGCAIEMPSLRSALELFDAPRTGWVAPTTSVVAGGTTATLTATGACRFEKLRTDARALFRRVDTPDTLPDGARPRLFGGFSFTGTERDTNRTMENEPWAAYPDAHFVLPAVQVSVTSDGTWLTTTALGADAKMKASERLTRWRDRLTAIPEFDRGNPPGVQSQQHTPTLPGWRDGVESVIDRIDRGAVKKIVLAKALSARLDRELSVVDVLARLGESYPGCYRFLFEPAGGATFFGATPERLVSLRGRTVDTEALAGSIGRGETDDEDDWLEQELRKSDKNNHEHDLVVDTIHRQLDSVTDSVETGSRTVRKLSTVQHLQTPIRGTLDGDRHVLELVERLHPTPAVGGLPPVGATRAIEELEGFDRGWYASPVGWMDADGNGTFVVAIRSAVAKATEVRLFAGAGIVSDSNPDEEWDELRLKFRPILDEL